MRTIDVISDAICPWCWIGRAHMVAALAELAQDGLTFRVRWRPFQLNPDMPPEGMPRALYRAQKFGSLERSRELDAQVAEAGRAAGVEFRFELMQRTPNTLAAHRTIRMAGAHDSADPGLQDRVAEALFRACFHDGRDIGDAATLDAVAGAVGLAGVADMLASDAHRAEVLAEDSSVRRAGISGVPSFLMDRHLLFSGAMPASRMAQAFREAAAILAAREAA
jgi:predicted DsbA family dithiol-disulfide isomerase